jgi:hypothetical protein
MAAVKVLLAAEHVHGAALAFGVAAGAARQLGHDALGIHAGREHVAVVAVRRDDGVAQLDRGLHADDDRFLADIEVTEAADQAHAVELARALLEAADQKHVVIEGFELVGGDAVVTRARGLGRCRRLGGRRFDLRLRGRLRH